MPPGLSTFNIDIWANADYVADYLTSAIRTPEGVLLARHRDELSGRVLELGCGAGRLTRLLVQLSGDVRALDVSPRMVAACAERVPEAQVELGDLRDLSAIATGTCAVVVGADNVIDVLQDSDREQVLGALHRVLTPGGLLLFSTHNRGHVPFVHPPTRLLDPDEQLSVGRLPRAAWRARKVPRRVLNRRRAARFEHAETTYAIVNDNAHDHRLAHYYISRDEQERQLARNGFALEECLDGNGRRVAPGEDAVASSDLHYAARRDS